MKKVFLLLVVFAFLFACAEKKVVSTQEEMQPPEEMQQKEEQVTLPAEEEKIDIAESRMGAVDIGEVLANDIHFDFDEYDIKSKDKAVLQAIADFMIQNENVRIRIEGHCDERGTNEYNLGLGDRRGSATKSYLMTLGVPATRLLTISYGEERPLCTASNEGCWWKNRRAHFTPAK